MIITTTESFQCNHSALYGSTLAHANHANGKHITFQMFKNVSKTLLAQYLLGRQMVLCSKNKFLFI